MQRPQRALIPDQPYSDSSMLSTLPCMRLVDRPLSILLMLRSVQRILVAPPPIPGESRPRPAPADRVTLSRTMPLDAERIERLAEMLRSGSTAPRVVALGVLAEWAGREDAAPLLAHARALAREGSPRSGKRRTHCLARWEEAPRRPDGRSPSAPRSHTELDVTSGAG